MTITRRDAMKRGGKAVVVAAAAVAAGVSTKAAQPDPLCEGVQALVNEIRQEPTGSIPLDSFLRLQEAADRLEGLPGIQPVVNELWRRWKPRMPTNFGTGLDDVAYLAGLTS